MKNLFVVFFFAFFFISIHTFATSGACSDHDGVNMSAGPDSDGSVICNDGWHDSSVLYSQMQGAASYPTQPSCSVDDLTNQYNQEVARHTGLMAASGLLGSSVATFQDPALQSSINLCKNQWDMYNLQLSEYQHEQDQLHPIVRIKSQQTICVEDYGKYAIPTSDGSDNCVCKGGYEFDDNNQCIVIPDTPDPTPIITPVVPIPVVSPIPIPKKPVEKVDKIPVAQPTPVETMPVVEEPMLVTPDVTPVVEISKPTFWQRLWTKLKFW